MQDRYCSLHCGWHLHVAAVVMRVDATMAPSHETHISVKEANSLKSGSRAPFFGHSLTWKERPTILAREVLELKSSRTERNSPCEVRGERTFSQRLWSGFYASLRSCNYTGVGTHRAHHFIGSHRAPRKRSECGHECGRFILCGCYCAGTRPCAATRSTVEDMAEEHGGAHGGPRAPY